MERMGVRVIVEKMEQLEGQYCPRFKPAHSLFDMAKTGSSFYTAS
jgi:hypothetical protein